MKAKVITFENKSAGDITLADSVFALPVRRDILTRMVNYQLAKRRAGTHKVKGRSEVALTGKKSVSQKGSGGARHHARSANIFVGGGRAFGPTPRSYAHSLPKKVRALALKTALSAKAAEGKLVIVDDIKLSKANTSDLAKKLKAMKIESALIVGGNELDKNFELAAGNIIKIDVLPVQGANVYDILRRDTLVLSKSAVETLEARLK
ncbi:MAG: 50S ribosomal protein L4 [Alphaproteobacteria bacterium]